MKVSTSLPVARPGERLGPDVMLSWAHAAEECGYWSVSLSDRIVYDNNEPLVTLSFVVGATSRLRVITDVLITPARETTMTAKQLATLDVLSGGRLIVGVGIGGRADDYLVTGRSTRGRGRCLEAQLHQLRQIWRGAPVAGSRVGPAPHQLGGPPLLVGGGDMGIARAAQYADGWSAAWPAGYAGGQILAFSGVGDEPRPLASRLTELRRAWQAAGRDGSPYVLAALYAGVGSRAADDAEHHITSWYGFSDLLMANAFAGLALGQDAIESYLDAYEAVGVDEVCLISVSERAGSLADLATALPPRFLSVATEPS